MSRYHLPSSTSRNNVPSAVRLASIGKIFIILVFLLSLFGGAASSVQATTITFTGDELLGKPTDTSITINIVPGAAIEYYYQYDVDSGAPYAFQTGRVIAAAGQPSEVTITGLSANTRYYYRMIYDGDGDVDDSDYEVRTEHSFWTQRAAGSTFTFTVTSDDHHNLNTATTNAMTNILNEASDFHIDLGDTFYVDTQTTQSAVNARYLDYRAQTGFGKIGPSVPIFLSSGNHENEEGWNLDDTFSLAQASIQARKLYYPTPINDAFYSGNTNILAAINAGTYGDQYREDYYAWTWGDALFMVIDEFQYTMSNPYGNVAGEGSDDPKTCDYSSDPNCQWNWTLGAQQYQWFKQTLENSHAKYKFIFSHNMLGGKLTVAGTTGQPGYVRGGCEGAPYFEWGGKNADGTEGFAARRTATYGANAVPLRQLMMDNGVSAYFHGHDHQYVYETCDGMVYQEVPSPGMGASGFAEYTEGDHGTYQTVKVLPNSGHLRITVTPTQATVDYISSASGTNGTVNYSYTIAPSTPPVTHNLTVNVSPSGAGTTSPSGTTAIAEGSTVPVTATANTGYAFDHWSGDCNGATCSVTMAADKTVTANFTTVPTYVLTTAVSPSVAGTISPAAGDHTYNQGTIVPVTATANPGYAFSGWSGACTGTDPGACSVTMDAAKSVTANFTLLPTYVLTMATDGNGTTTPAVGGHTYPQGTVVPISAIPNSGYIFDSWTGDADCADGSVTMNAAKTCTANFVTAPPGVTVDGAVSSSTGAANSSSVSFSHTTGTGSNRLLLVGVSWNAGSTARTISSVTFTPSGGSAVALTPVITQQVSGQNRYSAIYRWPASTALPSGQAGTVAVTFSGAVSNGSVVGAVNFAGVDQTTPLGTPAGAGPSAQGTAPTVTLTGLNGNELVFDNVFMGGSSSSQTLTAGAGQTQLWNAFVSNTRAAASTGKATGSSVTMSWTAASSAYWAIAAVPINPAPAGPAAPVASISATQLTWTSVDGATSYEVYMSPNAPHFTPSVAVYTGTSPYTLPSGTTNYYVVRAFMGAVPSANSNRVGRFSFSLTPGQ